MIPRILHRVVPRVTSPEVEAWWAGFGRLHAEWTLMTHRDPLDPAEWPLTSPHWAACANGAQLADLVRLEALQRFGGIYMDSDMQPLRSLEPLLPLSAFAGWEDRNCVPNAVLGAMPGHPAIRECIDLAIERISDPARPQGPGGTWEAGPGVTTAILPGRADVLILPPGSFFEIHYRDKKARMGSFKPEMAPWAFALHHWAGSWLPEAKRW